MKRWKTRQERGIQMDKQTYDHTYRQRIYVLWIVNVVLSTSTDFETRTPKGVRQLSVNESA